jgi:hypothetical protein
MIIAGGILLWGAIKNKNPLEAVKLVLNGQDPNSAQAFGIGWWGGEAGMQAIPNAQVPGAEPVLPGQTAQGGGFI